MKFQKRKLLESSNEYKRAKKNNQYDSFSAMNPLGSHIIVSCVHDCTEKCKTPPPNFENACFCFANSSLEGLMNDLRLELAASREERKSLQIELSATHEERESLQIELSATHEERESLQVELSATRKERNTLQVELVTSKEERNNFKMEHDALFDVFQPSLVDNVHVSVNQFIRDFEDVFIRKFVPAAEYKSSNNSRVKFSDLSIEFRKQLRRDENIVRFMNLFETNEYATNLRIRNQTSHPRFESHGSTDSIASLDFLLGKMDKLTSSCQERLLCAQFLLNELNSIKRSLPEPTETIVSETGWKTQKDNRSHKNKNKS
jgi:hypothetical protein